MMCLRIMAGKEVIMPIQFKLDHAIERTHALASETEQRAIKELVGVRLPALQAREVWQRIMEHKWYISERLGRDVGERVAAIDYFENIRPDLLRPAQSWIVRGLRGIWLAIKEEVRAFGAAAPESTIAAFEYAMRGTRRLAH
jgi:hypothetical protein